VFQLAVLSVNVIWLVSVQETSNLSFVVYLSAPSKTWISRMSIKEYKIKGKQKGKKRLTRSAKYRSRIKYHSINTERIFLSTHQTQVPLLRTLWPII
jgi:hypothetical protein